MDLLEIRKDFPVLNQKNGNVPLIYLDNAATTQVPIPVLNVMRDHYLQSHGNVHRGNHFLSQQSTKDLENAREKTASFINAGQPENIVFTQGTTASVNMIANGLEAEIRPEDEILVTQLEHHSNYLPWQQLCKRTGASFRVIPQIDGELDRNAFSKMLNKKTKIVACAHVSNLTGTVNDVEMICKEARAAGALTVIDGAQAVRHELVDMKRIGCDYYCFSGHKMFAGTGIGVLYGTQDALERLQPSWFGGGMVDDVGTEDALFSALPYRLEAGTGSFVQAITLGASIDYINQIGREHILEREKEVMVKLIALLEKIPEAAIVGHPQKRAGCVSVTIDGMHPYDLASILDRLGIAVRSGTHCAIPALKSFDLSATLRISPAFYNTDDELLSFADSLKKAMQILSQWSR